MDLERIVDKVAPQLIPRAPFYKDEWADKIRCLRFIADSYPLAPGEKKQLKNIALDIVMNVPVKNKKWAMRLLKIIHKGTW